MSRTDYKVKFSRLSKYVPEEVVTKNLKRKKFEMKLKFGIKDRIVVKPLSYNDLLEAYKGR